MIIAWSIHHKIASEVVFAICFTVYLAANRLLRPNLHHIVLRATGVLLLMIGLASAAFSVVSDLRP